MDCKIQDIINCELARQQNELQMIPSENYASIEILKTVGSVLGNKYSEGYPGKRYYAGNKFIDQIEEIANERVRKLFGAEHANVQPLSGSSANMAVYLSFLKLSDKILSMSMSAGGHLTHGCKASFSGKNYSPFYYHVSENTHILDYDKIAETASIIKPQMIIAGASSYPRKYDFKKFRKIADENNCYFMADIAHIAGLVAADVHENAVPYADVVTMTTQKTLRGPRGGVILCKQEYADNIDKSVFPGIQGGPHENVIAAKAICFAEAMESEFRLYGKQIVSNAKELASALNNNGLKLISGGTDNHMILIDAIPLETNGNEAEKMLEECGIITNKNMIPFDKQTAFNPSGIRLGTPALTTRGMKEPEMKYIGELITEVLKNPKNETVKTKVQSEVNDMCRNFPIYQEITKN